MPKDIFVSKEIEDQLEDNMKVLVAIYSSTLHDVGIMILGEDHHPDSSSVTIRIYLLGLEEMEWYIRDELQAFSFLTYASANSFLDTLESMSAIDLMLFMNNYAFQMNQPLPQ